MTRGTALRGFSKAGATRAFELVDALLREVQPIELTETVAERAAVVARSLRLKGSDAVHLASYERLDADDAVLVVADGRLADAASIAGYAVAVPTG